VSEAPALSPDELQALLQQSPAQRAQWMLNDVASHEEAWALVDANGWVVAKLQHPRPPSAGSGQAHGPAYALPLWPRQELAALEARDSSEQPRAVDLETLLEELLPDVHERGWDVLAFTVKDEGEVYESADFSDQLATAWEALAEED
jgi:hypothetical protein